jgi:hypothetical protein
MEITFRCPSCARRLPIAASRDVGAIRCGGCQRETPLQMTDAVAGDRAVDACPMCHGLDFYGRKDFDQKTGLAIIVLGALVSAGFYWYGRDLIAYGVLAGAVLIDLLVARWLGEVTVCYRCKAEFRGRYPKTAPAFDLHTADELELEYERRTTRR